jgi:hypothetical protein
LLLSLLASLGNSGAESKNTEEEILIHKSFDSVLKIWVNSIDVHKRDPKLEVSECS